ncbi:MAG: PVC-type heme-binding CxxCH protein [Planctomycetaceae bacterium]
MIQRTILSLLAVACATPLFAEIPTPRVLDPRLKIELFAAEPDLVTPTGIDVDHSGRVWVIESNTHFPPAGYDRHPTDRLWVMEDTDGDGKKDKQTLFADGFTHTMSVAVKPVWLDEPLVPRNSDPDAPSVRVASPRVSPPKGATAFLATRSGIWLLRDTDGDLKADERTRIVALETKGNYPHNGLAGFAFDALGWMYFGLGENLGAPYAIVGSDGAKLSGGGEGGNVYRCLPNGTNLTRWATGFWNPHASCVDAFGRLFTVDNDPDSRPPCRLLHVVPGGDYGYRFRNGRKGLHPFTSWNGELPGTLPMVAGTGEAPSGIVAYESDGLPTDYIGDLLVTSWGDHRIERFRLKPRGASFESRAEPIVQGGKDFRPVGIALAPDGSLYVSDWVKEDYKLHGHGRVWRISAVEEPQRKVIDAARISELDWHEVLTLVRSPRMDVRREAVRRYGRDLAEIISDEDAPSRARMEAIWRHAPWMQRTRAGYQPYLHELGGECSPIGPPDDVIAAEVPFLWRGTPGNAKRILGNGKGAAEMRDALALLHRLRNAAEIDAPLVKRYPGMLRDKMVDADDVAPLFDWDDPFIVTAAIDIAAHLLLDTDALNELLDSAKYASVRTRTHAVIAARRRDPRDEGTLKIALADPSPEVRRAAVQWAAEEKFVALRLRVEGALEGPVTRELFLATLAALEILDGKSPSEFDKTPPVEYLLKYVRANDTPAAIRPLALRMIPPATPELTGDLLANFLRGDDASLRLEAIRTLRDAPRKDPQSALVALANDERADAGLRAEARDAIAAAWHAGSATDAGKRLLLDRLAADDDAARIEAARALRGLVATDEEVREAFASPAKSVAESAADRPELAELLWLAHRGVTLEMPPSLAEVARRRPKEKDAWYAEVFDADGDAEAGRRVFHSAAASCAKCHTVDGRGGAIGPDLSLVARTMDRRKLAESIVEPSREIAPQWVQWSFVMDDGRVHSGAVVSEGEDRIVIGTPDAETREIARTRIAERVQRKESIMPEELPTRLTVAELRDLLAYLESRR